MPIGESFQQYMKRKQQEQTNPLGLNPTIDQLDTQIENAKARVSDSGFNPADAGDERNFFEKFTNLPKGQNAFFDTMELLNRPGNAVRNVIKNSLMNNNEDFLTALQKGISGKQNVSGSDLLRSAGMNGYDTGSKVQRGVLGYGIDVLTDPTQLIPAGLIAKTIGKAASPVIGAVKTGYNAIENASPALRNLRENVIQPAAKATKDTLGRAFVPFYRYGDKLGVDAEGNIILRETGDQTLKNLEQQTQRTKDYLQEESMRNVTNSARAVGIDNGSQVGRVMENPLTINKDAQQLVGDILSGRNVKLNIANGQPEELVNRINKEILNSPVVIQAIRNNDKNISNIDDQLSKLQGINIDEVQRKIASGEQLTTNERNLFTDYADASKSLKTLNDQVNRLNDIRDRLIENNKSTKLIEKQIASREKEIAKHEQTIRDVTGETYRNAISKSASNAELMKEEAKALQNYERLMEAKRKLTIKGDNIKRGITFNTLDSASQRAAGEGFEIVNPMPRLYKKSAGNIGEFLRQISPKGTFDQVVNEEFKKTLKPIIEELFKTGKFSTKKLIKGSPELEELKRILGNDIRIRSNEKGASISLIQNDPNKLYYLLNQAKTEVPESLTNPIMQSGEDIFQEANAADYPKLNESGMFDEARPESEFEGRVKNKEGKRYTPEDRQKAVGLLRGNKSVNQELKDIDREITVMRKEEMESIRNFNEANGIKMSKEKLNEEVEKALQSKPIYKQLLDRIDELNIAKDKAKKIVSFLRTETLNQSNLNVADLQFTDLLKLIRFDRPIRELSDSPIIHEAANLFTEQNQWLRDYAAENGIDIKEIQGYMTHVLSEEARKALNVNAAKTQSGTFGPFTGNKKVIGNRKYEGSAEDVNELLDKTVFETNAFFSTAIGQKRLIDYIAAESAKRKLFSNPDFAIPYKPGMTVPEGAEIIRPDQFKFFKVDLPSGSQMISLKKGQEYIVTKSAADLMRKYQRVITDDGIRGFLKGVDIVTGGFKRLALFSPGYHVRNMLGAMWNNYVTGMSAKDIGEYTKKAAEEVTGAMFKDAESALFNEYRQQGLSSNSLNKIEFAMPGKEPEEVIRQIVEDKSKTLGERINARLNPLKKSAWARTFETSREAGDYFDQINRFALYKWAREAKGLTADQARDLVKATHFDYSELTNFEKEFMTRLFPFYRWSRKNIPFQLQKFISDPRKFMKLYYGKEQADEEAQIDQNKLPEYMMNTFNPSFGNKKGGGTLSLNMPAEDISRISSPTAGLKTLVDSLNPAPKLLLELATNRNFFTGKEIQKFEGQKSQLGIPMKLDYAVQTLGGMPGRSLSGFATKTEAEQLNPLLGTFNSLGVPIKPYSTDKNEQIRKIQDLKKLRDYISYIEQETGKRPRTVNEIKTGTGR